MRAYNQKPESTVICDGAGMLTATIRPAGSDVSPEKSTPYSLAGGIVGIPLSPPSTRPSTPSCRSPSRQHLASDRSRGRGTSPAACTWS